MDINQTVSTTDENISVSYADETYTFHEPLGSDLVKLDKKLSAKDDLTDTERLAYLMAILSDDGLTVDDFLSLKMKAFKKIGAAIEEFFRSE